jgi:TRAP-type C4-dicarboxylate transport system substrate-binding protein
MQHGVVDGGENAIQTYLSGKHYEVAKYYTESNHAMMMVSCMINERFYQSIRGEAQRVYGGRLYSR